MKIISDVIAIIKVVRKISGAVSIAELWDVLKEGKETISFTQ
jgi:acyl transferase domain-containing protein